MHIGDVEERRFLQERMEGKDKAITFSPEGKTAILAKVIEAEQWEKFLGKKYVGTKRFGLDGGEAMIPALESIIKYGGQFGVREIVYGMAHRGRLNMLANVMAKPYRVIFHEFSGGSANPDDVGGSGDVKYHLGTSTDREFDGIKVHMSLVPNPSHLEAADPVVLGKARAIQTDRGDLEDHIQVLPVLLHGDAAFAGQGIVWECLGFSGVRGYNTGGCIHFIINNQIGFTTSPQFARSSPYPSDVAKGVQAPIFHVNGDDPEAVTFACKMAIEFRQRFHRDIVIDMWCYRRFGHNEGDEPGFTQPLMYKTIKTHPGVSAVYGTRLVAEGVIGNDWVAEHAERFNTMLETEFEAGANYKANAADWFGGRWAGLNKPADPETARRNVETGIEKKLFDGLARTLTTVPDDLTIHPTLNRVLDAKRAMFTTAENFDWATGEALAFGSLLSEGFGVRLSGQDSGRGTFSQRHAVWVDQTDEHKYIPLSTISPRTKRRFDSATIQPAFRIRACSDSSTATAGADFPEGLLVLWEAQFGDFNNGGAGDHRSVHRFSAEEKWRRLSTASCCSLPHGYRRTGSRAFERRVSSAILHAVRRRQHPGRRTCTTPAQLLSHCLRRQVQCSFHGENR